MSPATSQRATRRPASETREGILGVAQERFYWDGIRATGVDRLAAEAGVAPTALYRQFGSKDGLIAAYIQSAADGYRDFILEETSTQHGTPRERILRLFDATLAAVQPELCRGCPFLILLAEIPDSSVEAHQIAVATKQWVREHVHGLVRELVGVTRSPRRQRDGEVLGDQLALVIEGIYGSVQALSATGPAQHARLTAEVLLDAFEATRPPSRARR